MFLGISIRLGILLSPPSPALAAFVAPAKRVPALARDSPDGARACATTAELGARRVRSPARMEAQQLTATKAALAKRTLPPLVLDARAWPFRPFCAGALPRGAEKEDGSTNTVVVTAKARQTAMAPAMSRFLIPFQVDVVGTVSRAQHLAQRAVS